MLNNTIMIIINYHPSVPGKMGAWGTLPRKAWEIMEPQISKKCVLQVLLLNFSRQS